MSQILMSVWPNVSRAEASVRIRLVVSTVLAEMDSKEMQLTDAQILMSVSWTTPVIQLQIVQTQLETSPAFVLKYVLIIMLYCSVLTILNVHGTNRKCTKFAGFTYEKSKINSLWIHDRYNKAITYTFMIVPVEVECSARKNSWKIYCYWLAVVFHK